MNQSIVALLELIVNTGLTLAGASGAIPANSGVLAAELESAAGPLIQALGSGEPAEATVMTAFGTLIGVLAALKQQTGLDPAVLARVNQYSVAAEAGIGGYMIAQKGFDPANYAPVPPAA